MKLPQYYADQFGWPEMAEVVGKAYQALPPEDRRPAVFFGQKLRSGRRDRFLRRALRPAAGDQPARFLWSPYGADGSVVLVLGGTREDNLKSCRTVEPVCRFDHPLAMPYERDQTLWLCRNVKEPVQQFWPQLRRFG